MRIAFERFARRRTAPRGLRATIAFALTFADRSFAQSSDFVDTAASYLALFIIVAVPIGLIVLFWLVHVLPEKIAEKRQHPQKEAIHVLCLLSLVFGGLLWPLAWLWTYTKPVLHKAAYGRDKHDDYYAELEAQTQTGRPDAAVLADVTRLRGELDALEQRGELPESMQALRQQLAGVEEQAGSRRAV